MSSCQTPNPGHPDIYGLGIRLSFYLLWFAIIAFNWLPVHLRGGFVALRIMHLVFSFAVFIGLAGAISSSSSSPSSSPGPLGSSEPESTFHLDNGEVYITLLLISSGIYLLVPLYLCRVMMGCLHCCGGSGCGCRRGSSAWGQTDYLLVKGNFHRRSRGSSSWDGVGGLVPLLEFIFLLLVGGLQCWFWWSGLDYTSLSDYDNCGGEPSSAYGYGSLFGRIDLSDSRFRGFNSMVVLAVLIGAVVFSAIDAGICGGGGNSSSSSSSRGNRKRKRRKRQSYGGLAFLRVLQTFFSLSVAVTLLVAIELSIQWNKISDGVNQVTMPAQLMPLLITVTLVLIVILHSLTADGGYEDGGSGSGSSSGYDGSSKSGRSGSGGSGSGSGSGSSKGSSSSGSSRSGGRGGGEVVDPWNRVPNTRGGGGGGGQAFVPPPPFPPPPPAGFAGVPPPPFPPPGAAGVAASGAPPPPQVAQPFPVFPPRVNVNTVLVEPEPEPMEEGITEAATSATDTSTTGSSPSLNEHEDVENGSGTESIADSRSEEDEEGRKSRGTSYRSRRPSDRSEKGDHDNDHSPSRVSGEERENDTEKAGFSHPPVPINMPFGRSMPLPTSGFSGVGGSTEKFPPPAWPPGWSDQRGGHMQAQGHEVPPPPFFRPDGFPPAPPMPAFMPPGGVPPPPF